MNLPQHPQVGTADHKKVLRMRGIDLDDYCKQCLGTGVKTYGHTGLWRKGGIHGQAMTPGICSQCWGSGSQSHPWLDHELLESNEDAMSKYWNIKEQQRSS